MLRKTKTALAIAASILFVVPLVVGTPIAVAAEKGKVSGHDVWFATNVQAASVPGAEDHVVFVMEQKGVQFHDQWGVAHGVLSATGDALKGAGPHRGYLQWTYSDGATVDVSYEGEQTSPKGGAGTWMFIKGTGRLEGVKGRGTYRYWNLTPDLGYNNWEGEYSLP